MWPASWRRFYVFYLADALVRQFHGEKGELVWDDLTLKRVYSWRSISKASKNGLLTFIDYIGSCSHFMSDTLYFKRPEHEVGYWGLYLEPRMLMSGLLGES